MASFSFTSEAGTSLAPSTFTFVIAERFRGMDAQPAVMKRKTHEQKSGTTNDQAREVATKSYLKQSADQPKHCKIRRFTRLCPPVVRPASRPMAQIPKVPHSREVPPRHQRNQRAARWAIVAIPLVVAGSVFAACSKNIPHPPYTGQPTGALVEVDYPPPPARVEFVTDKPSDDAVWLNGEWMWTGRRWGWKPGGWVIPPQGVKYARLTLVRRNDGRLFAAPGTWRDADGGEVNGPELLQSSSEKTSAVVDPEGDPAPTAADLQVDGGADAAPKGKRDEP